MKRAWTWLLLALAAACAPAGGEDAEGTFATEMDGALAAIGGGDWDGALAALESLASEAEPPEWQLAQVRYATGIALAWRELGEETETGYAEAAAAFDSARALAGPGQLRLDATYDMGTAVLLDAERWRARIPEVAETLGLPAPQPSAPPAPPAPGAEPEEPPDPLAEARARYVDARVRLIERLRASWRDADTRANLELIQRRLRELEEIEREREEQQQQEQQDQQQEGEGEEGEPEESDEEQDDSEGEQEEEQEGEQQEGDPEQPQEGEGEQDTESQPVPEPQPGEEPPSPSEARPEDLGERHLTREEVMQLLDRLAELEEEGQALEERLRQARRVPVARDW